MSEKIQSVRGMNDLLPVDTKLWHHVESALKEAGLQYGYQEIRTPMLEKTTLFKQSIGGQTDIVEKEMYSFDDAGNENLSLRPEATASTVRACIQHGLLHNQQHRLWYLGPMFRRERPQKGRYRQFHQFGIEAFGWPGPDIDAEVIQVGERIWKNLNIENVNLEINSLGSEKTRLVYREKLHNYLNKFKDQLDSDSMRRLATNPLRILDSKIPKTKEIVSDAPQILECLSATERKHFDGLCDHLEAVSINYVINSRLVRGLDYYTSTVFEWTTDKLGAQSAVCAGGRYDSLVEQRGGNAVPGIGFALGIERLIELVKLQNDTHQPELNTIYFINVCDDVPNEETVLTEKLRDAGYRIIMNLGGGKLKTQLKRADQSDAGYVIIVGESERQAGVVQIKNLRKNIDQIEVPTDDLIRWCNENI